MTPSSPVPEKPGASGDRSSEGPPQSWLLRAGTRTIETLRSFARERSGSFRFRDLVEKEFQYLDRENAGTPIVASGGIPREPWVCFTDRDHLGLALSGGGIRSATFNLGVLQALEHESVLKEVHYLATVSGGGYIGGFWTRWLQRNPTAGASERGDRAACFPVSSRPAARSSEHSPRDTRDPAPVRHLREFSRFLVPRLGFFESETWDGIVAFLGGLLPALVAAVALMALTFYVWSQAAYGLAHAGTVAAALAVGLVSFAIQLGCEAAWLGSGKQGRARESFLSYVVLAAATGVVAAWFWRLVVGSRSGAVQAWFDGARVQPGVSWVPFALSGVWVLVGLVSLFLRAGCAGFGGIPAATRLSRKLERAASRLIAPAVIWAMFALLWEAGRWVRGSASPSRFAAGTGAGAAGCSALFVWLRGWLGRPIQETNASRVLKRTVAALKPLVPQLLAYAAAALLLFVVCLLVQGLGCGSRVPYGVAGACVVLLATLVWFNPARVGLHDFYRSRISRCYLGAAAARDDYEYTRPTVEQPDDDIPLEDLLAGAAPRRPVHLICCTANDLSGDVLGTLYRGGRSATVSPFGLSLGDDCAPMKGLRLSSALTASAAAFNSQMGSLSMRLGPAVSFLMCAFNLRLGLWVPHPRYPLERRLPPGLPFFYEMFGLTACDAAPPPRKDGETSSGIGAPASGALPAAPGAPSGRKGALLDLARGYWRMLHLSDGGHFENLAIYELVRRHCRYVIASDCGADPQAAFDDLGNAVRRIREDFGVEVELDTEPLRPGADGLARQHAVVGTIHYDGLTGTDKGTIIYLKPVLTGDEPPDVLEYKKRNAAFPHETTGDQFYDEPQFESYRRLGEHAGRATFRYAEEIERTRRDRHEFVENLFFDATDRWFSPPDRQDQVLIALNDRCAALDAAVRDSAPAALRAELFPEAAAADGESASPAASPDDEARVVFFCMQAAQIMEDVWRAADLAAAWSHPVNDGWMNYFRRWAATASFRRWWPLLRPIYGTGLRDFVRDRFDIVVKDTRARVEPAIPGADLSLASMEVTDEALRGFAWKEWESRYGERDLDRLAEQGFRALDYRLTLAPGRTGDRGRSFQVGFLLYRLVEDGGARRVEWSSQDLFVPSQLVGAGITTRFLDSAIRHFEKASTGPLSELRVVMDGSPSETEGGEQRRQLLDPGSRLQRVRDIGFYRSRSFTLLPPAADGADANTLRLPVGARELGGSAIGEERSPDASIPTVAGSVSR